jgi:hypothetical protein
MFRWLLILLAFGVAFAVALGCIAGCGGSNDGAPEGALVAAGTFRTLQTTDAWNYYLTWVHNGITYANRTAAVQLSTVGPDLVYTLTVNFGAPYATQTFKFRLTQAGDGTLTIDGIQAIDQAAIQAAAPVLTSPAGNAYVTSDLTGTTVFSGRNLVINLTRVATETVAAVDGNRYECYKYEGTVSEDGYDMDFTLWINPSIGNVVKLVYSYDELIDTHNALLTATLLLSSKTLN